jgi:tRNA(Arg) A34 adenosine deaminase TadA
VGGPLEGQSICRGGFIVTKHEEYIRKCLDLAISAGKNGNHTFGAVLVHNGKIVKSAENTVNSDDDSTRHAELNLVVKSQREFSLEVLSQSTLYTSTAPCLMCTAAIWSAGISRIVYSVSYATFAKQIAVAYKYIPCEEVYERLGTKAEIIGPILEEEGLKVFQYWQ